MFYENICLKEESLYRGFKNGKDWSDDVAFVAQALECRGWNLSRERCALNKVLRSFSESLRRIAPYCLDWTMNDSFHILSIRRVPIRIPLTQGSLEY